MPDVDLAILGGGLSGSLTLLAVTGTAWARQHTVALLDRQPDPLEGRHWGYWGRNPVVPGADGAVWSRLVLRDEGHATKVKLREVHYRRLSGVRLDARVREACGTARVHRMVAEVTGVAQLDDQLARITLADGSALHARHVLDSTRSLPAPADAPALEFLGYRVPSGTLLPSPTEVTLMDLRVPQRDGVRFVYVVPGAAGGGLVELTAFLPAGGRAGDMRPDLHAWLATEVGEPAARAATRWEAGHYPLLRSSHRRRVSRSVALIGLGAGCLRSATGYGVEIMARDARSIARSLDRRGHPFVRHPVTAGERWLDRVFLRTMRRDPAVVRASYLAMFEQAGGDDVLRFLNGELEPRAMARVIRSMPAAPFLRSALHG